MRLSILDNGHRRRVKVFLALTSTLSRVDSPDIVKMLLYRPGFLTRPLLELTSDAMRGPSYWTPAEREYLALCTALRYRCPFCADTHTEMIRIASDGKADPADAGWIRPELRAMREFLDEIGTADGVDTAGVAGLPEHAKLEALRVGVVWNIVNRLANAFGFVLRDGQLHSGTKALHRFGYRFPGFLLADGTNGEPDHGDAVAAIRRAVLDAPARTDSALRTAVAAGDPVGEPWQSYAGKVRDASYKITDNDVAGLVAAGRTEDEIFEVTVASAVGAALRAFDAGRCALAGKSARPGNSAG